MCVILALREIHALHNCGLENPHGDSPTTLNDLQKDAAPCPSYPQFPVSTRAPSLVCALSSNAPASVRPHIRKMSFIMSSWVGKAQVLKLLCTTRRHEKKNRRHHAHASLCCAAETPSKGKKSDPFHKTTASPPISSPSNLMP